MITASKLTVKEKAKTELGLTTIFRCPRFGVPQALMSSKAKNGINHKEFRVTSEGVAMNLARALYHQKNCALNYCSLQTNGQTERKN